MSDLKKLYANNVAWAEKIKKHKPNFFSDL